MTINLFADHPSWSPQKAMVAIERGPLVYGIEESDCPLPLDSLTVSEDADFEQEQLTIDSTRSCSSTFHKLMVKERDLFSILHWAIAFQENILESLSDQ